MLISIALATYNGEQYLKEQLDSIINQSFSDWELIVCDDCSTDGTVGILKEYAKKDSRIFVQQNQKNLGFKKNFESIFHFCKGEYIACCDQDDVWTKNHLEILIKNIGDNDCIGANALICNAMLKSKKQTTLNFYHIPNQNFDDEKIFKHECYYNLIQGTACLFKRSLLSNFTKIPDEVEHHDHWLALNASLNSGCRYIPDVILYYRNHEKNAIGTKNTSFTSIFKTLSRVKSLRKDIYRSRLALLKTISCSCTNPSKQITIAEAQTFFTHLQKNVQRLQSVFFFIKNYEAITLSSYKQFKTFLYRVIALAIFGILL